jgi:hypothetical protein
MVRPPERLAIARPALLLVRHLDLLSLQNVNKNRSELG